ncbi:EamA/RhaT family transporter [Streptomyces sp. NPDC049954]|uniref:EamA/RhaT family transporter n=1 Tax=Streptomyces sp. NPDC049954 TaxID=3155779 RepID=UPI00343BC002
MSTQPAREDETTGPAPTPKGPLPEPIRFFGTTWLHHDGGYAWRRVAVAAGSLLGAVAGAYVLRLAYDGVRLSEAGGFVTVLLAGMFALCTVLAFVRTWESYGTRPDPATQQSLRGLLAIGFVGRLVAHFLRCLSEAPGEGLHRAEYEKARARYARRTGDRAGGRPSGQRRTKK